MNAIQFITFDVFLYLPILTDAKFFVNLELAFPRLERLFIFKYQVTESVQIESSSIRELDIDYEEFTSDGDRVSYSRFT